MLRRTSPLQDQCVPQFWGKFRWNHGHFVRPEAKCGFGAFLFSDAALRLPLRQGELSSVSETEGIEAISNHRGTYSQPLRLPAADTSPYAGEALKMAKNFIIKEQST